MRLLLCAWCRANWHLLYHAPSRNAVEVAEREADGKASAEDLRHASWSAEVPTFGHDFDGTWRQFYPDFIPEEIHALVEMGVLARDGPDAFVRVVDPDLRSRVYTAASLADRATWRPPNRPSLTLFECFDVLPQPGHHVVRCVFGNPFRRMAFAPSWRTEAVVALACVVYDSRDFRPMPVLADALEDGGCDQSDVLAHCRADSPHVRDCWVVDHILDKAQPATT